jgi:hypothetical protein
VELRLSTENAVKIWVNGDLVGESDVYHTGTSFDQFSFAVQLRRGSNEILLKVCQNEMTEDWATTFKFQLRVCNTTGTAVLSLEHD